MSPFGVDIEIPSPARHLGARRLPPTTRCGGEPSTVCHALYALDSWICGLVRMQRVYVCTGMDVTILVESRDHQKLNFSMPYPTHFKYQFYK